MAPNLHLLLLLCAAPPCPPETAALVDQGWSAYRADSIRTALAHFIQADSLCAGNLDAKVGLGYARLRLGAVGTADSLFSLVVAADSGNGDAWDGLVLTRWRRGDRPGTREAVRRALALHPDNATTRGIQARLEPDGERAPLPALPERPARLRVDARTRGDFFQVPRTRGGTSWQPFYIRGVNLGVALPGRFPAEFPPDSSMYAGWLADLAEMHANTVRVYTILPPAFYRALRAWNLGHPGRALWLLHGVWTELPPGHDFQDRAWKTDFRLEMRRVVDLVHGHADLPERPGHASGRYDADVSRWTLGYIIGREWEPYAVVAYEERFGGSTARYAGRYLRMERGLHIDAWMAEQCDYLLTYEVERYNTIRPIAYTNWPTLDPLTHPTETTGREERAIRERLGRPTPRQTLEYDNDAIGLDASLVKPTGANPAGWFASYHAYPYYPDFMLYDPGYSRARSSEGPSNYFGYLTDLKRHHPGIPLVIAEYGVPSSRGNAHWQPQGRTHGGHDEIGMAAVDARLTREIREAGLAGGVLFAWMDEWFKRNWVTIAYELPAEHNPRWLNPMDAEQNYGILGMYAGDSASTPRLGGPAGQWRELETVATGSGATLRLGADAAYLYAAVELPGWAGRPFPAGRQVALAFDTHRADLGQHGLPGGVDAGLSFDFLATFRDTATAELLVAPGYGQYVGREAITEGDELGRFSRRPIVPLASSDGRWDTLFVITNRARFGRDGTFFPARGHDRGALRYGTEAASTLSDWYWDSGSGLLQVRLPWALLNVSDPSTRTVLFDPVDDGAIGTATSDGFRVGLLLLRRDADGTLKPESAVPALAGGRWPAEGFRRWEWPTWTTPRYHQRLKPVYDSLRATWSLP